MARTCRRRKPRRTFKRSFEVRPVPAHRLCANEAPCSANAGAKARKDLKDKLLVDTWNQLDWKEESELASSHQAYETLVKTLEVCAHLLSLIADRNRGWLCRRRRKRRTEIKRRCSPLRLARTKAMTRHVLCHLCCSFPAAQKSKSADSASSSSSSSSGAAARPRRESKSAAAPAAAAAQKAPKVADDGLTLGDEITLDFVTAMMDHFKANKVCPCSLACLRASCTERCFLLFSNWMRRT